MHMLISCSMTIFSKLASFSIKSDFVVWENSASRTKIRVPNAAFQVQLGVKFDDRIIWNLERA